MKNTIIGEAFVIIILLLLIIFIPTNTLNKYEKSSASREHSAGVLSGNQQSTVPVTPDNQEQVGDSSEKILVSVSRPKGGLAAYEDGSFVEPPPETVIDDDETEDGTDGESDSDDETSDDDGSDGEEDDSGDEDDGTDDTDDEDDNKVSYGDFEWTLKDPTKAIDSGLRATTTAPIKLRKTPTIQTEENVITTLNEGDELIVTEKEISSPDPDVPNWVEVYYKGEIGYISAKYVTIS